MKVSYEGIGRLCATFAGSGLAEGEPVSVSANGTVAACAEDGEVMGVVAAVSRGKDACSVQVEGFVTLPYSGTAPAVGYRSLAADGDGGVKTAQSSARSRLVVDVDTAAGTVTFLL